MVSPEVCVLKTDGTNCDEEMAHAFDVYGAKAEIVHVNQLRSGERNLAEFQILAGPGGFSYGDDISSGKVLAVELTSHLSDQVWQFMDDGKPGLFVCNGFQTAIKSGILPYKDLDKQSATLTHNSTGRFNCEWIDLLPVPTVCKFTDPVDFETSAIPMQEANGEGRFMATEDEIERLNRNGQVVFRYAENANGSADDIAGVCDPSGVILGMMPHPERSVEAFHPDRSRTQTAHHAAAVIFKNIINYAQQS